MSLYVLRIVALFVVFSTTDHFTVIHFFFFFASLAGFGMKRGYRLSFISLAIMSYLLNNLSTWKWLLSWQG